MTIPANLRAEFATLEKSFLSFMGFFGGQGFVLQNPDRTLRAKGGGQGLLLYERVLDDCHAHAVFQQRSLELISQDWRVVAASEASADQKARELVEAQLMALGSRSYPLEREWGTGFDGVALSLLDATAKGYAVGEIMWAEDGREIYAAEVRQKDQRRFGWVLEDEGWGLRLLTDGSGVRGEPLPDRKFIYHSPTAADANPYGLGLCSKVFWPVFFKRQNVQFWLIFADKFGSPTPVGKYAPGTSDADKDILLEALTNLTQGLATAIPEGMLIEFLEATRSGSISTYEGLCRYMDEQISEAVLGQTGTTNQSGDGGSRARDEVAREGMGALIQADADLLSRTLDRTLIRWMVELNRPLLGEQAQPPHFEWVFEEGEDLNAVATRDKLLFEMGFRRTLESLVEMYGEGYEAGTGTEATPDEPAAEPRPTPDATADVQATALNGAQVTSLLEVVQSVVAGQLPMESAARILQIAFPTVDDATARALLTPTEGFVPVGTGAEERGRVPQRNPSPEAPEDSEEDEAEPESEPEAEPAAEPEEVEMAEAAELTADGMTERLGKEAAPHLAAMLRSLQTAISGATTWDEIKAALNAAYPDLEDGALVEVMREALTASRLAGIYEAQQEAK